MDRMTGNGMHQGIGLQIPPYKYADFRELMDRAKDAGGSVMLTLPPTAAECTRVSKQPWRAARSNAKACANPVRNSSAPRLL